MRKKVSARKAMSIKSASMDSRSTTRVRMAFFHPRTHNNIVPLLEEVAKVYDVHIYSYENNKPLQHPHITYHKIPYLSWDTTVETSYLPWAPTILSAVRQNDILIFKGLGNQISVCGLFFARLCNKPAFVFAQGISQFKFFGGGLLAACFRYLLNKKQVPILSQTTRAHEQAPRWSNYAHFLPFGVRVAQSQTTAKHKSVVSATKSRKDRALTLLVVSKIQRRKNIIAILSLFSRLQKEQSLIGKRSLRLIIASRRVQDESYLEQVNLFIATNNLSHTVKLVIDANQAQMAELYRQSDVYLLLSYDEPAAYSHLEAMNYGVPVIVNAHNGTSDYIVDGKDGIILRTDEPDKVYKQITTFLNSDLVRAGIHAQATIQKSYAAPIIAKQFMTFVSNYIRNSNNK